MARKKKRDETTCVLFNDDMQHCVGLTVKSCDAHGKAILSDGSEYKCNFYKDLKAELESRRKALARCEETGLTFQENDRIDINFEEVSE